MGPKAKLNAEAPAVRPGNVNAGPMGTSTKRGRSQSSSDA